MIASIDWATAVVTLVSTTLGGVLAVGGSVWAARREVRRTARIKLYAELLPRIEEQMNGFGLLGGRAGIEGDRPMIKTINEMKRTALLAGKPDHDLAYQLVKELTPSDPDMPPTPLDHNSSAHLTLRQFQDYLKGKIR